MTETAEIPAVDSLEPDDIAPYGYMIDRATGERRAKKKPGRQIVRDSDPPTAPTGAPPSLEELRAGAKNGRAKDRAPGADPKTGRSKSERPTFDPSSVPPFRAGPIARGMNLLYMRAGKLIRFFDPELGAALMMVATSEGDGDLTVGDAWEEVARTNVRVRAVLLRLISGGSWSRVAWAHAPIGMAILAKPAIARRLPLARFVDAWAEGARGEQAQAAARSTDVPPSMADLFSGVSEEEMQAAAMMAQTMMAQMSVFGPPGPPARRPAPARRPVVDGFPAMPPGYVDDRQAAAFADVT